MDSPLHKTINKSAVIENWITILINTYRENPSNGLAKVIHYYLQRIINEEEVKFNHLKLHQYCSMGKFWAWRSR